MRELIDRDGFPTELLAWGGPTTLHALCLSAMVAANASASTPAGGPTTSIASRLTAGESVVRAHKARTGSVVALMDRMRLVPDSADAAGLRGDLAESDSTDFTGLLEAVAYAESWDGNMVPAGPAPDTILVDEAQDLNPLQWLVVHRLLTSADAMNGRDGGTLLVVAGDDDQAIMEFQGAAVAGMLTVAKAAKRVRVLDVSYRLRSDVVDLAQTWSKRIRDRYPKTWASAWPATPTSPATPATPTRQIAPRVPPSTPSLRDIYGDVSRAVGMYGAPQAVLCRSGARAAKMASEIAEHCPVRLVTGSENRAFVGPAGTGARPVLVTTIHQSKGREWSDVWLDLTLPRASRTVLTDPRLSDFEHRVWYVGLTRSFGTTSLYRPRSTDWYPQ